VKRLLCFVRLLASLLYLTAAAVAGVEIVPVDPEVKTQLLSGQTAAHALADPDYFVWGFTVMEWSDGKYHGYYARWPTDRFGSRNASSARSS